MPKSKLIEIEDTNIKLKNCPPKAKIKVYYEDEDGRGTSVKNNRNKATLNQRMDRLEFSVSALNKRMDHLEFSVSALNKRMDHLEFSVSVINKRMDRLEKAIINLTKIVSDGFVELRQDVKTINTRLDYIVKANNLKDLPNYK